MRLNSSHPLTGMQAAQQQMQRSAQAIARPPQPGATAPLEREVVRQKEATYGFLSNLKMLRAQDHLLGTLLDERV